MTQLAEATLHAACKTIDNLPNTFDDLEDLIIVMGHPDIVPGAGDLLSHKFRPIISHCHHGFATTTTGYTADGLRVSVKPHRMRAGSTEVFTCDIVTLKCTDVRDQHAKGAGYCVCQHHPCRDVRHPTVLNADNFYDALVSEIVLELEGIVKERIDNAIPEDHRVKGKIRPYVVEPNETVFDRFVEESKRLELDYHVGIATSPVGCSVPKERHHFKENPMTVDALDSVFTKIPFDGLFAENLEMEMRVIVGPARTPPGSTSGASVLSSTTDPSACLSGLNFRTSKPTPGRR